MEPTKEEIIAQNKQLKKQLTKVLENNAKLYAENKKLKESISESWSIINVLNMAEMDRGEGYPRALIWLNRWEHLNLNKV